MSTEIAALLIDIEGALRQMGLWQSTPPSAQALASEEPFAVDTLTLPQWLQFIFLPTLYQIIEAEGELPLRCGIAPMAQEYFKGLDLTSTALVDSLLQVDVVLSKRSGL